MKIPIRCFTAKANFVLLVICCTLYKVKLSSVHLICLRALEGTIYIGRFMNIFNFAQQLKFADLFVKNKAQPR